MFSQITTVAAALVAFSNATEAERGYGRPAYNSYNRYQAAPYQAAPQYYGNRSYQAPQGYSWTKRSAYRPRDVVLTKSVDKYWESYEKPEETIRATCQFDFLGYSDSTGSIEITQAAGDMPTFIGEFTGINPGLHGLKIHEFGDLEYGCGSTGDVFNPYSGVRGHSHHDMNKRRVGDLEQVQGRWDLGAEYKSRDSMTELSGPNSIIGRAMVLYERRDDHDMTEHEQVQGREGRMRQGMGEQIACCVIGLKKGEKEKVAAPAHKVIHAEPEHEPHHFNSYRPRW